MIIGRGRTGQILFLGLSGGYMAVLFFVHISICITLQFKRLF